MNTNRIYGPGIRVQQLAAALAVSLAIGWAAPTVRADNQLTASDFGSPAFQLPALPYAVQALEPYMSTRTMGLHYGKHHQAYVDNLNKLVTGTPLMGQTLEDIIRATASTTPEGQAPEGTIRAEDRVSIFNNAAQVWNHNLFWQSMKPDGGGKPTGRLLASIEKSFGTFDNFRTAFIDAAVRQFGSGWVWLVQNGDALKIVTTANADTPLAHGQTALLACDVWEHAYYLDYQNRRRDFVIAFLDHLVNWEFAGSRLTH